MKYLFVCLFLVGCGGSWGLKPELGVYDVTSEVFAVYCNAPSNTPEVTNMVVEIAKEKLGYALYLCDSEGNRQLKYANSYDGFTFRGEANFNMGSCAFKEVFEFELTYADDKVSGESKTTLTASCGGGVCTEKSNIEGTKRP